MTCAMVGGPYERTEVRDKCPTGCPSLACAPPRVHMRGERESTSHNAVLRRACPTRYSNGFTQPGTGARLPATRRFG